MINLDAYVNINFWQLFTVLLATAILQAFVIAPSVDLLKKYYRKCRINLRRQFND